MKQPEDDEKVSTIEFLGSILLLLIISFAVAYAYRVGIFGINPWDYFLGFHLMVSFLTVGAILGIVYIGRRSKGVLLLSLCYATIGLGGLAVKLIVAQIVEH